jgi:hypothetical protein
MDKWIAENGEAVATLVVEAMKETLEKWLKANTQGLIDEVYPIEAVNAVHEKSTKRLRALRWMAEFHGSTHDEDCPMDDTCDCSHKAMNDLINQACKD